MKSTEMTASPSLHTGPPAPPLPGKPQLDTRAARLRLRSAELLRRCRCGCSEGSSGFMQRPGSPHSPPRLAKPPGGARPELDAAPASHQLRLGLRGRPRGSRRTVTPSALSPHGAWRPRWHSSPSLRLRSVPSRRSCPSQAECQGELVPAEASLVSRCREHMRHPGSEGHRPDPGLQPLTFVFSSGPLVSAARATTLVTHQGGCSH